MSKSDARRDYVDRIREETHRYAQDLLADNERLRLLVASLETERTRIEEKCSALEGVRRENESLRGLLAAVEREKIRLQEQLLDLRAETDRRARDESRLREELARTEDRKREFSAQFAEVERQNSNLANLYVASYRLHGTLDREEILAGVQEILANLVGCEQTAVFDLTEDRSALRLVSANGIERDRYRTVPLGRGPIGAAAASGEAFLAGPGAGERSPEEPDLTACIPLRLDGRVIGAIAMFRLLPQKAGIEELDRELFDLLATHAATALYCADLHARLASPSPVGA
jgi:hypothetical protein